VGLQGICGKIIFNLYTLLGRNTLDGGHALAQCQALCIWVHDCARSGFA